MRCQSNGRFTDRSLRYRPVPRLAARSVSHPGLLVASTSWAAVGRRKLPMNRTTCSRRLVLRGLGGAAVAAPFLASVAERDAKTQGMPPPAAPKRLIVFYTYASCLTNRWFPALSHGRLTRDDYAAMRTLAPMAPFADKLLMVRGIRAMNEWSFEGTLGQKNDPYTQVNGTYFTCHPVTPNATEASGTNAGKFAA